MFPSQAESPPVRPSVRPCMTVALPANAGEGSRLDFGIRQLVRMYATVQLGRRMPPFCPLLARTAG